MTTSRRSLLRNAAALSALSAIGWHPRMARAAVGERKFLFFFASGAWDTTTVFDPHHSSEFVDMDPLTTTAEVGNLLYTAGDDRPNVARFFRRWGGQTAIINGIDAHTVGHDSGRQMTLTGTSASSYSDWPTLLASQGSGEYPLPHLVFSGPSYPGSLGASVVRGGGGTLLDLIDGSLGGEADAPTPRLSDPADSMIDAFVYEQSADFARERGAVRGLGRDRASAIVDNLDRAMELEGRRFEAGLSDLGSNLLDQATKATELMRLGLSRCAMIGIPGGWDSHGDNTVQAPQFDAFFEALDALMDHMARTPGLSTPWLIDEVVIVCMSEFGRTPLLNGAMGKDHWPYNSTMVVGSGVRGNRLIGGSDDGLVGLPTNFSTGALSDSGDIIGSENVGVALLKLGGIDPETVLPGVPVLEALLA